MKHRMPSRAKKLSRKRQQVRRPCTDRHDEDVAGEYLAILQHNSLHATVALVQVGKLTAFAQFDAEGFGFLNQRCHDASAFRVACFKIKKAVRVTFRVPRWKTLAQSR